MNDRLLVLLHLCDSLFPIGSFSHSDGLESATDAQRVRTADDLQQWMDATLEDTLTRLEGPAASRAWTAWRERRLDNVLEIDNEMHAIRPSWCGREASRAMGTRLLKTWAVIHPEALLPLLSPAHPRFALPVAFGVVAAASSVPHVDMLQGFMYTRLASTVSAAMRLIALGQLDSHRLLAAALERVPAAAAHVASESGPLRSFAPALDLSAMSQQSTCDRGCSGRDRRDVDPTRATRQGGSMRMRLFPRCKARQASLAFFTLFAVTAATMAAQSTPASAPRSGQTSRAAAPRETLRAGFSVERLRRVDAVLQRYVNENRVAGAVALVLRDGQPVYEKAVGWADREANRRMTPDTIFRIASQTKAITSVGILTLVEEGLIAISDPVSRFIPAYAKTTVAAKGDAGVTMVPAKRPITIKDLLTHTAGISYGREADIAALYEAKGLGPAAGFGWYTADKDEVVCDTMERLATLPFSAQPGEAWVYGYNTDILGCVIEKASGMSLDAYLRTKVLEPLGMKDTSFFLPPGKRDRLAAVYRTEDGKLVRAPDGPRGQGNYIEGPRRSFAGGAGLLSTIGDYSRFLEMIRNGGALNGARILSPRTVALMTHNQIGSLHSPNGLGFGLGFQTTDVVGANGLEPVGAYGWAGAYGSMYRVDPGAGIDILLMIQMLPQTTDLAPRYFTAVHQAFVQDTVGTRRQSTTEFQP